MWKVLVVDDNFVNRKFLVEILKGKAVCDVAANGNEALVAYDLSVKEDRPYDAILLDIAMPEMDGIQVLEKIRGNERSRGIMLGDGIPVIMVTAYKQPFMDAFNKGCDDYLLKPIDPDVLINKIEEKINR